VKVCAPAIEAENRTAAVIIKNANLLRITEILRVDSRAVRSRRKYQAKVLRMLSHCGQARKRFLKKLV
jgi:hypothetical protein